MSESEDKFPPKSHIIDRWDFLKRFGLLTGGVIIGGCGTTDSGNGSGGGGNGGSGSGGIEGEQILYAHSQDFSYWESLLFYSFQGVVNRDKANIYFNRYEEKIFLDWYKKYPHLEFEQYANPYDLLTEYASDYADGYVMVDPEVPDTINVGANYASIETLLPVTEQLLNSNKLPPLDVVYDLHQTFKGVDFKQLSRVEVNQWIYENQWPDASRTLVSIMNRPFYKDDGRLQHFYTRNSSRDYAVAERALFFDLSSNPSHPVEKSLKDKILSEMEPHSISWGWHVDRDGEHEHIAQLSKHGLIAVGGANEAPNFSFHSRVEIKDGVKNFREYNQGITINDQIEDKIYLTFVMSDGDSLNHLLRNAHGGQWLDNERGAIPFNWEMQLKLADIGPGILDYFQSTATGNDFFMASASGIGYTFPSEMPQSKLDAHLRESKPYFSETGMNSLVVLNGYDPVSDSKKSAFYEHIGDKITGIIQGYTRGPETQNLYGISSENNTSTENYMSWLSTSLPINHGDPIDKLEQNLNSLAERRPERPLFVPIHIPRSYFRYSDLGELMEQLNSDTFEAVDGSSFNAKLAKNRSNKVVLNSPEFIVPDSVNFQNGISVDLKNCSDQQTNVEFRAVLDSNSWENSITSQQNIAIGAKNSRRINVELDLSGVEGNEGGVLKYFVNDELRVQTPAEFIG
jgi:hypothetical protein